MTTQVNFYHLKYLIFTIELLLLLLLLQVLLLEIMMGGLTSGTFGSNGLFEGSYQCHNRRGSL